MLVVGMNDNTISLYDTWPAVLKTSKTRKIDTALMGDGGLKNYFIDKIGVSEDEQFLVISFSIDGKYPLYSMAHIESLE